MTQIKKEYTEQKLVIITRQDLKTPGYQLPQACHSLADFAYEHPEKFKEWKETSNSIICLSARSEEHLIKLYEKYRTVTEASLFFEPDIDAYTSACFFGTPQVRKAFSHLPLSLKTQPTS